MQSCGMRTTTGKTGLECGNNEGFVFGHVGFQMPERRSLEPCLQAWEPGQPLLSLLTSQGLQGVGCQGSQRLHSRIRFSDSLLNAPHSSSPPGFSKEPGVRCGANGLQCPFPSGSHSPSPSSLPKPALTTTLWENVLFHNSY